MKRNDREHKIKPSKKKLQSYAGKEAAADFHLEVLNIKAPKTADLKALKKDFNLTDMQIHELGILLRHVQADLDAFNKTYADTARRTKNIAAALKIEEALFALKTTLEKYKNELNECLPIDVQERIGEAFDLSFARFSVNDHVSYMRLNDDLDDHFKAHKKINAQQIERVTHPRRLSIGLKAGGHMLSSFIEHIHRPMAVWTALHNANSGGRPRKYAREYLLFHLASESKALIGKAAPISKKGRFVDFAIRVVELCGLDPQGADAAVPEIVREVKNGPRDSKFPAKKKSKKV